MTKVHERGRYYAFTAFAWHIGCFIGWQSVGLSRMPINIFGMSFLGWRLAFFIAGSISIVLSCAISLFLAEPKRFKLLGKISPWDEVKSAMTSLYRLKTFRYIILEGTLDHCIVAGLAFYPMYLQHCFIPDTVVGNMTSFWSVINACGVVLGGKISDIMVRKNPDLGRIWVAQFSMASAIPIFWMAFHVIPRRESSIILFLLIWSIRPLLGVWGHSATKLPLISQLAEPHKRAS